MLTNDNKKHPIMNIGMSDNMTHLGSFDIVAAIATIAGPITLANLVTIL